MTTPRSTPTPSLSPLGSPTSPTPRSDGSAGVPDPGFLTVGVTADGGCGCAGCGCGGGGVAAPEAVQLAAGPRTASGVAADDLDLRPLTREQRHDTVFAAAAALVPGEAFVLAVDHDPVPLRERLLAQEAGELGWTYLQSGPDLWRVEVSRVTCC
ncbi:DUF2249 domain-containing protein [Cellulomonas sp. ATA003]|uniref:DUF2249 domain-containing protein n=1 Tax=Cellulomonas sp. ATA003 TaxID=3073064 RepID=UPI002872CD77|nr:DUF2249 domain-containing protein [Cellulomonas sp. ATA003]WNB85645.1 DUF2249 domain-containing protein [Cellulomonas sp. ATA003]